MTDRISDAGFMAAEVLAADTPALSEPRSFVPETVPRRVRSPAGEAWHRFRKHKLAAVSLLILLAMVLVIALGPLLWRVPIDEIDFSAQLSQPSAAHPFGTDDLGQDLLARMIYGGRISSRSGSPR